MNDDDFCKDHSGTCVRLTALESSVSNLFRKWDKIQALIICTLTSAVGSLIGVIFLLIKK